MSETAPDSPEPRPNPEAESPPATPPASSRGNRNQLLLIGLVGGGLIFCLLVVGVGILAYRTFFGPEVVATDDPATTPTPFVNTGNVVGADPIQINGMSNSGTISVTLDIPVQLTARRPSLRHPIPTHRRRSHLVPRPGRRTPPFGSTAAS
jgi:hypothetical protein